MANRRTTTFEERDYIGDPRSDYHDGPSRAPVRTLVRDDSGSSFVRTRESDRMPAFLREDARHTEAGPMVLRQRDTETIERHHDRSPSPVRMREERIVRSTRSDSPPPAREHDHERIKIIEKERVRSPSPIRGRSPSPRGVRFVEHPPRSPSVNEHEHIRIVETERGRLPSRSPSPPHVVKPPVIEREVITHYTDVDHGVIQARPPTPERPARRRVHEDQRETDIDIQLGNHRTEVDIHEHRHRSSSRNRHRERGGRFYDDELVVHKDRDLLVVDDIHRPRRRARSAAPNPYGMDDEAGYITSRIDSRGRMGEAWGGATKRWNIVDVPPGTERVRMDGVGGGSTETQWSKYSGVRRTKFIPERDGAMIPVERQRSRSRARQDRLSVAIDRRVTRPPRPPPQPPTREMWTEVTKDLVSRQAIKILGYRYEETKWCYYIMEYLPYEDVLRLIEFSEEVRRARYERARELEWEYGWIRDWDRRHRRAPSRRRRSQSRRRARSRGWEEERSRQMEVVVDQRRPAGGYYYY